MSKRKEDCIMPKRKEFSPETKRKVLLWSDRHCCLCGKACGIDIVVHHIDGVDNNDRSNALPICYDCHAKLHHYDDQAPIGTKYKPDELIARRDQIYERHTNHLVPPINIRLVDVHRNRLDKPSVKTIVRHLSDSNPARVKIIMTVFVGKINEGVIDSPYYNGEILWNMNPRAGVQGNFELKQEWIDSDERLFIEIDHRIIDIYDREHPQLLFCYSYVEEPTETWSYEPTQHSEIAKNL